MLNENMLNRIIAETIQDVLSEKKHHVLRVPSQGGMPPMGDEGMGEDPNMGGGMPPMGEDPNAQGGMPPMGDEGMGEDPNMGGGMPPMEDEGGDSEIGEIFNKLSTEDKSAVIKYAKSMLPNEDGSEEEQPTDGEEDPNMGGEMPPMGGDPNAQGGMPNESRRYLKRTINEIFNEVGTDRKSRHERDEKKVTNKLARKTPFVATIGNKKC